MIGLMVPSAFAGWGNEDEIWEKCTNRAQHLEDLDQCNKELQDRQMMETMGPFIFPIFGIIFIILIILVIVVWKLRSKNKVK